MYIDGKIGFALLAHFLGGNIEVLLWKNGQNRKIWRKIHRAWNWKIWAKNTVFEQILKLFLLLCTSLVILNTKGHLKPQFHVIQVKYSVFNGFSSKKSTVKLAHFTLFFALWLIFSVIYGNFHIGKPSIFWKLWLIPIST